MRIERLRWLLPVLGIASLIASAMSILSASIASAGGLTPRAPILIVNNGDFTPANGVTSGLGTESDPYVIENWSISAETQTESR